MIPILLEMASWGALHDLQTVAPQEWIAMAKADKARMTKLIRKTAQSGGSIFSGPNSVVSKLALRK